MSPRKIKSFKIQEVPFSLITESDLYNLRVDTGDVGSLMVSIVNQGLLEPLHVKETLYETYTLIHGYRRFAALQQAIEMGYSVETVPAIVESSDKSDAECLSIALAVNKHKGVLPVEEGYAFFKLHKSGMSYRDIANTVGRAFKEVLSCASFCDASDEMKQLLRECSSSLKKERGSCDHSARVLKSLSERKTSRRDGTKLPRIPKGQLAKLESAYKEYKTDTSNAEGRSRLESMLELLDRPCDDLDNLDISRL